MVEDLGVKSYLKKIRIILNQLATIGVTINNENLIQIILNAYS
jgi:hypothetical protein